MSTQDARAVLGVGPTASWHDIRGAYRAEMRRAHPDTNAAPNANRQAARLNTAFAVLRGAAEGATPPEPARPATAGARASRVASTTESATVIEVGPDDVFLRLLDAAAAIGDVSYVDPEAGLIQLLLGGGGPSGSQLLISVDADVDPTSVAFTLNSPDAAHAPDIREVVQRLGLELGEPA